MQQQPGPGQETHIPPPFPTSPVEYPLPPGEDMADLEAFMRQLPQQQGPIDPQMLPPQGYSEETGPGHDASPGGAPPALPVQQIRAPINIAFIGGVALGGLIAYFFIRGSLVGGGAAATVGAAQEGDKQQ